MSEDIVDAAVHTPVKAGGTLEAGDYTLQFTAIEHHCSSLVAQEITRKIPLLRRSSGEEVGSNVIRFERHTKGISNSLVDLVPRQRLVRRDLKRLPNGMRMTQQTDEPLSEVFIPCERPE